MAQGPGPGPGPGGPPPVPALPAVPAPPENPITEGKRVLGKILFWEEQLSSDNTVACGTCHMPEHGGVDPRTAIHPGLDGFIGTPDDKFASRGIIRSDPANNYSPDAVFGLFEQVTTRRAPDFTGGLFHGSQFWDGRAVGQFINPETGAVSIPVGGSLESQAVGPILSDAEMSKVGRTWAEVTGKLQNSIPLRLASNIPADMSAAILAAPSYPALFQAAFGTAAITAERIAFAIATYERTLVPDQTAWDDFNAGNTAALTANQAQGLNLFATTARCGVCHVPPVFSDGTFRNIGLRPIIEDNGRQGVTGNFGDRGRFKVPSLRNVALRSRFFHNGQHVNLTNAVGEYNNSGGPFPDNRDPVLTGLLISPAQRDQIADFLSALTDPRAAAGTFPFDRPTLRSEIEPAGSNLYGAPTPGTGGFAPAIIANAPAGLGSIGFKLGVARGLGGSFAILGFSTVPPTPGLELFGVDLHVDPETALIYQMPLSGFGPGGGFATVQQPLPANPALGGFVVYTQFFVFDPAAPFGLSASRGAEVTLF